MKNKFEIKFYSFTRVSISSQWLWCGRRQRPLDLQVLYGRDYQESSQKINLGRSGQVSANVPMDIRSSERNVHSKVRIDSKTAFAKLIAC